MSSHNELMQELKEKYPESNIFEIIEMLDRKDFIPGLNSIDAYNDKPVSIGSLQNSLSPSMVIEFCEMLNLKQGLTVLEIGMGSGYMTACVYRKISPGKIITIERIKDICVLGKYNLKKKFPQEIENKDIRIFWENGLLAEKKFPKDYFDRIYFTGAVEKNKINLDEFIKLLKEQGILIYPSTDKNIYCYTKSNRNKPFLIEKKETKYPFDVLKGGKNN